MNKYKSSRWNSYFSLSPNVGLIYNASTDSFLCLKNEATEVLQSLSKGDLEALPQIMLGKLTDAGIIVPSEEDEVQKVKDRIHKVDYQKHTYEIIVNPTLDCNFNCWYCYENHIKGSAIQEGKINAIISHARNKINQIPELKRLHISFFGGEPLMQYNQAVVPILSAIKDLVHKSKIELMVSFTTNSFLLTDAMIDFLRPFDPYFQITLDGGRENHNNTRFGKGKVPSFDAILGNVQKLALAGLQVTLRINYTSNNIDSTEEILEILSQFPEEARRNIRVDYQQVWQDKANKEDAEKVRDSKAKELRNRFKKAGFPIANHKTSDMIVNSCYADKVNELLVNFNGDVFACTARDFSTESRLGFLNDDGTVTWNEEKLRKRMESRFIKKICHECRIAPICGGGCRTKCVEHSHHDGCNLGLTDQQIDELILDRFEERYMKP